MIFRHDGDYLEFSFYASDQLESDARRHRGQSIMPLAMADAVFVFDLQTNRFILKKWRFGQLNESTEITYAVWQYLGIKIDGDCRFMDKQEELLFVLKYR